MSVRRLRGQDNTIDKLQGYYENAIRNLTHEKIKHGPCPPPPNCLVELPWAFYNVLWTRVLYNVFVGRHTLELGMCDTVSNFNDGNISRVKVLQLIEVNDIGSNNLQLLQQLDDERINRQQELAEQNATQRTREKEKRRTLGLDEEKIIASQE
ncbi:hypothetical protein J6590_054471, partial [Homalodisca vitripennis]